MNKIISWTAFATVIIFSTLTSYIVILKSSKYIQSKPQQTLEKILIDSNPVNPKEYVKEVIDGDTTILNTGEHVRYIGINSPEKGDCFYEEAKKANETLVFMKSENKLRFEQDKSNLDKYGRLLRYVYIDYIPYDIPETKKQIFANEYLVKNGFAKAIAYPPDIKYQEVLKEAQSYAKENKLGLWNECKNL